MVHKLSFGLLLLFILTCPCSAACRSVQPPADLSALEGCWWGYWDIPFYGGKAYIGLEIGKNRRGRPVVAFHRITNEEEHWKTTESRLDNNTLIIPGPRDSEYRLKLDRAARTLDGVYHTRDMDIPTRLKFSPEITKARGNPDFFKRGYSLQTSPEQTEDGLECAPLSESGLDPALTGKLIEEILSGTFRKIRTLLVIKDGKLVVEEYFWQRTQGGFPYRLGREDEQNIYSATRSFTAILLGMAVDQGLITGVDENISPFFPEYQSLLNTEQKKGLTIENFLTMESGFPWGEKEKESYQPLYDPLRSRAGAPIIEFIFALPMAAAPGKCHLYNNELSTILGEIIRRRASSSLPRFADRHLFSPLGISDYHWFTYPDGVAAAGNGLRMKPRDMAKFGLMILNKGVWKGRQLLSRSWLDASFERHTRIGDNPYGYHWWLDTFSVGGRRIEAVSARGHFGQFIYVVPALNLAAVFTSASDEGHRWDQPIDMMARYLIPAALTPSGSRTDSPQVQIKKDRLKHYEGIYRFREDRFAVLGIKGNSLFLKRPDRPFKELHAASENSFFSELRDIVVFLNPQGEDGRQVMTLLSGNIEEKGIRLDETPNGNGLKRIFFLPRTWFLFFFWFIAAAFSLGMVGILASLLHGREKHSPSSDGVRFPHAAVAWAGLSAVGSMAVIRLILAGGISLEEDINLGIYTSGWDERIALSVLLVLISGLTYTAVRLWRLKPGATPAKILYSIQAAASLGLVGLLWASGLFAAFF